MSNFFRDWLAGSLQYMSRPPGAEPVLPPKKMPKGLAGSIGLLIRLAGKALVTWFCNKFLRWTIHPALTHSYSLARQTAIWSFVLFAIGLIGEFRTVDNRLANVTIPTAFLPFGPDDVSLGKFLAPVSAQMPEAALTELPKDWTTRDVHRLTYFASWCQRPDTPACPGTPAETEIVMKSEDFLAEWRDKRTTYLRTLSKPVLAGKNLAEANITRSNMPGIDLRHSNLRMANLSGAQLEEAALGAAQLDGARFLSSKLAGANLSGVSANETSFGSSQLEEAIFFKAQAARSQFGSANLNGASLVLAQMSEAGFSGATLIDSNLFNAYLRQANFYHADLANANLRHAQLSEANLNGSRMNGAKFYGTMLKGASLIGAQLKGTILDGAFISGSAAESNKLQATELAASVNNGGALRYVDLSLSKFDVRTDFRNSFADGSVKTHPIIGRPCQWPENTIEADEEFIGRWRGWIESYHGNSSWTYFAPPQFRDIPAIPFDKPGCTWKTGPLPTGP